MTEPFERQEAKRNPLIPVGLTVLAILVIPLCIYSFGPEGPIKKKSRSLFHRAASSPVCRGHQV